MLEDLKILVNSFDLPMKEFTKLQNDFFKKFWNRYSLKIGKEEWKLIFSSCMDFISSNEHKNKSKYNALRLMKFALMSEKIFGDIYISIIGLFLYCIKHEYWTIRMESIHLLAELEIRTNIYTESYSFSENKDIIKDEKLYNYCYPLLINLFFQLWDLNDNYELENKKSIKRKDRKKKWFIPCSYDTENTYLKQIRKAIEELDTPHLVSKMKEFWFVD